MILDFKNHLGQWKREDKVSSIGKFFWNKDELMVLVDVNPDIDGVQCIVGDRYGNLRTTQWQRVTQGSIATDFTKKTVSQSLIEDGDRKPEYDEHIRRLCAYLHMEHPVDAGSVKYDMLKAAIEDIGYIVHEFEANGQLRTVIVPA